MLENQISSTMSWYKQPSLQVFLSSSYTLTNLLYKLIRFNSSQPLKTFLKVSHTAKVYLSNNYQPAKHKNLSLNSNINIHLKHLE